MFLLDTNVISELMKPRPNPRVVAWAGDLVEPMLSVITIDELYFVLTAKPNKALQRWLDDNLSTQFTILDISYPIARHAGVLRAQLARRGRVRTQADMLIAATAALHGATLATRNARDFEGCGTALFDPFRD